MDIKEYIASVNQQFQTSVAREHAYRPALQQLLSSLMPYAIVTNEPAKIACGAPDYIITEKKTGLPIAFFEAKDIDDADLDGRKAHKEQFTRYKNSLDTIVFTDYLDFHLYESGEWVDNVRIGEIRGETIVMVKENEAKFLEFIAHVGNARPQKITSASKLAAIMASKARLLAETIKKSFSEENNSYDNRQLQGQYEAFKKVLIHDLTTDAFSDIYAQTIAYGMFAARLHDTTPEDFSRMEAATLIPKSNPFLRQVFQSIAGFNIDDRISWIVDDLVATFQSTDIAKIMGTYSQDEIHNDPMIHFYEDFLAAYDPLLRKAKGVWYTPQPVVQFIVRSVDEILKKEFSLPMGLADSGKIHWDVVNEQYTGKKGETKTISKDFHRVQILDPATGTGTFLAEVIRQIYSKFENMKGMWQGYVEDSLLPRLNGFEILMASYAVAHLKLDILLKNTGYNHVKDSRFKVFLTNSLEECDPDTGTLFSTWLSDEATEANYIKRDCPVMVVIGNPPYSISSQNNSEWILGLLDTFKEGLNERKINLNDDYIKFLALAQNYIERNGNGIIGFITNNSFIDGITHRQMRLSLLKAFDEIYIFNLHGNSKKRETSPDGSKDENVFDIMQGVSINLFVKKNSHTKRLANLHYYEVFGRREHKYSFLSSHDINSIAWQTLNPVAPYYFFTPKDFAKEEEYKKGFAINNLFPVGSTGIESQKDSFCLCNSVDELRKHLNDLIILDEQSLRDKYQLGADGRNWKVSTAKSAVGDYIEEEKIIEVAVSPFDTKFTYLTVQSNGFLAWPRTHSMRHMLIPSNFSLVVPRQTAAQNWHHAFVENRITNGNFLASAKLLGSGVQFPLFINVGEADSIFETKDCPLAPNYNEAIIHQIELTLGQRPEAQELFDYIYAVLYSPKYRECYKELLKIDFPRIPYPTDLTKYKILVDKGALLRHLHLMIGSDRWPLSITYPICGDNLVQEVSWSAEEGGRILINPTQYLGNVPASVWNAYIGGYQPAQKWLKDRKGRTLSFQDILHYGRILYALEQTDRIMKDIDEVGVV